MTCDVCFETGEFGSVWDNANVCVECVDRFKEAVLAASVVADRSTDTTRKAIDAFFDVWNPEESAEAAWVAGGGT